MRKRIQIDPKNDAGKVKKSYYSGNNNHTTVEYGTPLSELRYDDKNGKSASRPESGTYDTGKLAQKRMPGPIDRGDYHQDELSSGATERPEKKSRTPLAADTTERRNESAQPETHVYQNPIKLKTSQELGSNKKSGPVRSAVAIPHSAKRAIENQVGNDGNPKKR